MRTMEFINPQAPSPSYWAPVEEPLPAEVSLAAKDVTGWEHSTEYWQYALAEQATGDGPARQYYLFRQATASEPAEKAAVAFAGIEHGNAAGQESTQADEAAELGESGPDITFLEESDPDSERSGRSRRGRA